MLLNFAEALAQLGPDAGFRIANEVRPDSDYAFQALLPEQNRATYDIKAGNMTIRSVMAGLVGLDSNYPPGAIAESSIWNASTAKLAIENFMPEESLRYLQTELARIGLGNGNGTQFITGEALNFLQKVVIQPLRDVMEWLRGQALLGAIDWKFNQKHLDINYGIPDANMITPRTISNNDWYGHATTSKFWDDILMAKRVLKNNVRGFWLNSSTMDTILYNAGNSSRLVTQTPGSFTMRRLLVRNGVEVESDDSREVVTFNIYDGEGEVLNPSAPNTTHVLKFLPDGKIIAIGNNSRSGYRVGEASTPTSVRNNALGYTHIAPTIEAGGRPGRWAELYTPQNKPYQLNGRGVINGLPVIEAPEKIAVLTTELAS